MLRNEKYIVYIITIFIDKNIDIFDHIKSFTRTFMQKNILRKCFLYYVLLLLILFLYSFFFNDRQD